MAAGMFNLVRFRKGAYILMEGQPEKNDFYIIKKGSVRVSSSINFSEKQSKDGSVILNPGDFFGVISCMARRSNLETVYAVEETLAVVVQNEKFDLLIQNNPSIAMKIIRYFSRLLRYYDSFLSGMISKTSLPDLEDDNPENLFELGEYFYNRKGNVPYAGYAYLQLINELPGSPKSDIAREKLNKLDKSSIKIAPKKDGNLFIYEDRQVIFLQGETGHALYVIQEGEVKITRFHNNQEILLGVLKKGDIFGEMAIIEDKPRNANAFANAGLKLMFITKQNFDFVVHNYPKIATKIIEMLSDRIWIIYRQMINMLISNPETKIYDALYTQLLKNRIFSGVKKPYVFDFGAEDILKYTGMLNETGWNIWKELKQTDKNIGISPEGKIDYEDISQIEHKINQIRRQKEINQNFMSKSPDS
jgi:CRP/FNR family transcriptional regulator